MSNPLPPAPPPPPARPLVYHAIRTPGSKWGPPAKGLCNRKVSTLYCETDPEKVTCATCKRRLLQRLATGHDDGEPEGPTEP